MLSLINDFRIDNRTKCKSYQHDLLRESPTRMSAFSKTEFEHCNTLGDRQLEDRQQVKQDQR